MSKTLLFDGSCPFCRNQVARLQRWAPDPELRYLSFRLPGVLDDFPGLTEEACDKEMKLAVGGVYYGGMEAAVRVVSRRWVFKPSLLYYVPGIRQIADAIYRWIAARRFEISGGVCNDDVCSIHGTEP